MGTAAILLAAAAAGSGPPAPSPDIAVTATVRAREVTIEQQGEARIALRADPGTAEPVRVERNRPKGQRRYRNLELRLDAEARIAAPAETASLPPPATGE